MKNTIISLKLLFIFAAINIGSIIKGQTKCKIENIQYSVNNKKIIVQFDIKGKNNKNKIDLIFYDKNFRYIYPKSLSGDFGENITIGKNKSIVWDVAEDMDEINSPLKPMVIINGKDNRKYGGSSNAWLSAFVPGLGDYFVSDPSQIKFKPYYRTISSWGLIGLGIYALNQRYKPVITTIKTTAKNSNDVTSYEGPTQYWAFQTDGELFITLGVGVWIYDIVWVAIRGKKNQEYKQKIDGLSFYDQNSNTFQYGFSFSLNKN